MVPAKVGLAVSPANNGLLPRSNWKGAETGAAGFRVTTTGGPMGARTPIGPLRLGSEIGAKVGLIGAGVGTGPFGATVVGTEGGGVAVAGAGVGVTGAGVGVAGAGVGVTGEGVGVTGAGVAAGGRVN